MQWYLNRSGRPEGPFEEAQIIQMVIEGFVPWNAMVGAQGADAWIPIIEHPAFADALSRTSQAGLPPDLRQRAHGGRPPGDGSFDALDPTTGSPYSAGMPISDVSTGMPRLNTRKLVLIGLALATLFGAVSFALSRVRGGFLRVLDTIGEELVRYTLDGEAIDDDWPDLPLANGARNVHATDRDAVRLQLIGLGPRPASRFVTLHVVVCGRANSIEFDAYSLGGNLRIGGLVTHTGDTCSARRRDSAGRPLASATASGDRRIAALGERGVAVWESLRSEPCDLPLLAASDLESIGIPTGLAAEFTAAETLQSVHTACSVAKSDQGTESPFVELGTVGVVVAGEMGGLGVVSSRLSRTRDSGDYTLEALESRRIGQ